MTFYIVHNRTKERLADAEFTTLHAAQYHLEDYYYSTRREYSIIDTQWRIRAQLVQNQIDFSLIGKEPIVDHFTTWTTQNYDFSTMFVQFLGNDEDRERLKWSSPMKIGRYLTQFYGLEGDKLADAIRILTSKYLSMDVKFARTAEEIRNLYLRCGMEDNGVNSCMTHPVSTYSTFNSNKHPVEAYAGMDLAVAYIERNGRVCARALCWPDHKIFGRVYGDFDRFHAAMSAIEYAQESLDGAKFPKIELHREVGEGGRIYYLCPYIDDPGCITEFEDHFEIGATEDRDRHPSGTTDGYVRFRAVRTVTGEWVSDGLVKRAYHPATANVIYIKYSDYESQTECVGGDGHIYWKSGVPSHYGETDDGKLLPLSHLINYCVQVDGKWYQPSAVKAIWLSTYEHKHVTFEQFFRDYAICEMTGHNRPRSQMRWMEHQAWWSEEAFAEHGVEIDGKNYARVIAPYPQPEEERVAA